MGKMELGTRWFWYPRDLRPILHDIRGGGLPTNLRRTLMAQMPTPIDRGSSTWQLAEKLANMLAGLVAPNETADIGATKEIMGHVSEIICLRSDTSDNLTLEYKIRYSDKVETDNDESWLMEDLPKIAREMSQQIRHDVQDHVESWFAEQFGAGELDPEKWKTKKTELFISYRGSRASTRSFAEGLRTALGEFENRSLFIPRIDRVDLNAGDWLNQLMVLIKRCQVFIPILSQDYLQGPVAVEELHTALRHTYTTDSEKRIVPVIVEGDPRDYVNHFIGNKNMVLAQDDFSAGEISPETVDKVAHCALGVSMNEFE